LLADVVPPVPPVAAGGDYRLVCGANFGVCYDVTGLEFNATVAGLEVMSNITIAPIPPGVDTGLGYYRVNVDTVAPGYALPIAGIEVHGNFATK
jgi:hypothetical protein